MRYRFSDFEGRVDFKIYRDGVFERTGKLSTPLDGLCVPLRSSRYLDDLNANRRVAAVVTTAELAGEVDQRLAVAISDDPDAAHSEIHAACAFEGEARLKARPTVIDPTASIDGRSVVSPFGVVIGARVYVGPHAVVAPGVSIEDDSVIHNGVSLGGPGFNTGVVAGRRRIVPQLGGVRIGSFVEILPNCCIARAVFGGDTVIGEETVMDNLVNVAHDVRIGRRVQICALASILGRSVIGDNAYIGPSAVITNGVQVGENAKISIGAVVTQGVPAGGIMSGNFAITHEKFLDHLRSIR